MFSTTSTRRMRALVSSLSVYVINKDQVIKIRQRTLESQNCKHNTWTSDSLND